ncbi:Patatin [Arcobacter nitrofigilis DSM 7299]|uniref:Patatin n=1 Tax=Arcobacter nitrofigilis (strain ATCC 33309 / DSM 7299 / CCUG 15893 / LMG 7604 / NCTC 12251 / CI) TaxID=572480 RepID=D5V1C0_ARCNC|nr:CBASS cGAMP-activated phospholipase [Arcobacter nitrofigilis]ADG94082.1 Patatin [Arcobacter nitrofigilis DSM 7299]
MDNNFRVLAIDGGGIRGIFSAIILKEIEDKFKIKIYEHFDLVAGTSTGSILASAIAIGLPLEEIIELYKTEGSNIFKLRQFGRGGLFKSRYDNGYLKKLLEKKFKDITLFDKKLKTKLLIPTTDISNGDVHIIKSYYLKEFKRDKERKIRDVILASCSAPLYFNPIQLEKVLLADGGLWANNPSLVAITEGVGKIKKTKTNKNISFKNTRLLSIGTGIGCQYYNTKDAINDKWGFLSNWNTSKLIDTILNLQSINVDNTVSFLLPKENYLRINFESDNNLSLDSMDIIPELEAKASKYFSKNIDNISKLISLEN